MIPRYRAWDKIHKTMYEVDDIMYINFEENQICVKTLFFDTSKLTDLAQQNPANLRKKRM